MKHLLKVFSAYLFFAILPLSIAAEAKHDFTKYEKEIAAFEESDRLNPVPKGAVLFTGASHTRRWTTLTQDFPQFRVINRGFGGSDIVDATHFAPRIIFPYAPRAIYFRAGGNEMWNRRKTPEQVFSDFKDFVATVHSKLPNTDIIYISNVRSIARVKQAGKEKTLNELIANYIRGKAHLRYIDIYDIMADSAGLLRPELFVEDGLHFSPAGYQLLAAKVRADLTR